MVSLLRTGRSDTSIVDKLWSVQPPLYCWDLLLRQKSNRRLAVMAAVATAWGARLTWNFYIKGGYESKSEDYRWAEVRKWFPKHFEIVNIVFICLFQELILLAIAAPAAVVFEEANGELTWDIVALRVIFLALVAIEAVADWQMYQYQCEKWRRKKENLPMGQDYGRGFITSGLWSLSRHPNYMAEVLIWWTFFFFSVKDGGLLNWSILGALFLTLLFAAPNGSADLTEHLSLRKYGDAYRAYQARVPKLLPLPSLRSVYVVYFASHIPITLFIDAQALLPSSFFPTAARRLLRWHVQTNEDFLMKDPPIWFQSFIGAELILQVPFFFLALRAFATKTEDRYASLFRVYGAHVATTLIPIIASIASATSFTSPYVRARLLAAYAPYFLIPLSLIFYFSEPKS